MKSKGVLTITRDKKEIHIPIRSILYVLMDGNHAFIHTTQGQIFQIRMTLAELRPILGDQFILAKRGCLVSVIAIHDITDTINLSNGESLPYAQRNKRELLAAFRDIQEKIIRRFHESAALNTLQEYHEYYRVFDHMPIAFADIEMVFDEEFNAVDWIFRYGNPALAELEKLPLQKLVGSSFSSLFPNMDVKWLRTYERAALFRETLKIVDYSPEIDSYLDIICFPTFEGHCGCILFDVAKVHSFRNATDTEKALAFFFSKLLQGD